MSKTSSSPTGIRTLATRVRGGYPNQLDYRGLMEQKMSNIIHILKIWQKIVSIVSFHFGKRGT